MTSHHRRSIQIGHDAVSRHREAAEERLRMRRLLDELRSVRNMTVRDRFDEGCQLRAYQDLASRWVGD